MSATTVDVSSPVHHAPSANRRRRLAWFSALAVAVAAAGVGYRTYWVDVASRRVTTDNAYTEAENATVTSQIEGRVAEVRVVDSQKVGKGDVLVVIDPTDATLAAAQAEADLARAKAQEKAAEAELQRAGIDLKRRAALAGSGAVSGDELTKVRDGSSVAKASLEAAQAMVALARARYDRAQVDLERTVIRSPVDGVVARREVQPGQRVQPSAPLMSVVPVQDIYVNANFKEVQLKKVREGQPVKLVSDLYGKDVVFHGTVEGFDGGTGAAFALIPAQNATGNWIKVVQRLPVRIQLKPDELAAHPLRVGLSMTATVDLGPQQ
ncbi:MAG: efflux RND transporter periplasmic adaptor subunit [Nevskia sp.]|nr:efflux RND transporter periplasmic adaptor subunit [Nevskia sp.]